MNLAIETDEAAEKRIRALGILRAWLAGSPLSTLPEDAEEIVRRECAETVSGLVRAVEWTTREHMAAGKEWIERPGRTDVMRGYYLGMGRGMQIVANAVGHVLNWSVRRGLK